MSARNFLAAAAPAALLPEPQYTGNSDCPRPGRPQGLVMDYFDGNTVTAEWNYAQQFAMSDNLPRHRVRAVHRRGPQPGLG